jgi:hippurate hydrolase
MGGEDFGRYYRADKAIRSTIFWVGGVPAARMTAAKDGKAPLPSLHSPFWAPDADAVVETGARALTTAALAILRKGV